jgi:hypothetical protein
MPIVGTIDLADPPGMAEKASAQTITQTPMANPAIAPASSKLNLSLPLPVGILVRHDTPDAASEPRDVSSELCSKATQSQI